MCDKQNQNINLLKHHASNLKFIVDDILINKILLLSILLLL